MRVYCYFNLHKKVWSVKALEGDNKGRVIAHSSHVVLTDAVGRVGKKGRERVIREGRKNVHAGLVGQLFSLDVPVVITDQESRQITYNPYKFENFVYKDSQAMYNGSDVAYLDATTRSVTVF